MNYKLNYISDDGHGWLEVPLSLYKKLKSKASSYSYYDAKKKMVYLEEDSDMGVFIAELKNNKIEYSIERVWHDGSSPIRELGGIVPEKVLIISKDYNGDERILVNEKTGRPIFVGQIIKRTNIEKYTIYGGTAPHKCNSEGKVYLQEEGISFKREVYTSCIGAKWEVKKVFDANKNRPKPIDNSLLCDIRREVISYDDNDLKSFSSFKEFYSYVGTANAYEDGWKPNKYKPYYQLIWDEYQAGKLTELETLWHECKEELKGIFEDEKCFQFDFCFALIKICHECHNGQWSNLYALSNALSLEWGFNPNCDWYNENDGSQKDCFDWLIKKLNVESLY